MKMHFFVASSRASKLKKREREREREREEERERESGARLSS